jgi:hypothetical protein
VTSLLRQRIGYPVWRAVHWLAYASWPLAVVHGLGTGTDARTGWMLAITVACVLAVLAAVLARLASGWPADRRRRVAAGAIAALAPVLLAAWLLDGPLASGWARRAGTPVGLLGGVQTAAAARSVPAAGAALAVPFTTHLAGRIARTQTAAGIVLDIALDDPAGRRRLTMRIVGAPTPTGGVTMTSSRVRLGTPTDPGLYSGRIVSLAGGSVTAALTRGTRRLRLDANLTIAGPDVTASTTVSLAA